MLKYLKYRPDGILVNGNRVTVRHILRAGEVLSLAVCDSENPEKLESPENPEAPENPDPPEKPEIPESPEKPDPPEKPEIPESQENLEKPGQKRQ